jgi:hypothetical protein
MDIRGRSADPWLMVARVLTLLAMLSIAVVTTVSGAHVAQLAGMHADHTGYFDEITLATT